MARKSRKVDYVNIGNKENLVTEAENQCEKVSHAALYAKASVGRIGFGYGSCAYFVLAVRNMIVNILRGGRRFLFPK